MSTRPPLVLTSTSASTPVPPKCHGDSECLVSKREQLLQRIAQQRQYFHQQMQPSFASGDVAQRLQRLGNQAKQHPRLLFLLAALVLVVKPRRILTGLKMGARAWIIWKTWIR